ncbi:hypothetical protein EVAR_49349_1 [Eumeta japonica]|uniref:Uncharacterized protein n=1 Tax=Eumeta variegata TaxID=151549 RepID=A0A4C1XZ31_EUMVA|nr:hypothetical protein EVAR_49349_1 [Eumeta japonica]
MRRRTTNMNPGTPRPAAAGRRSHAFPSAAVYPRISRSGGRRRRANRAVDLLSGIYYELDYTFRYGRVRGSPLKSHHYLRFHRCRCPRVTAHGGVPRSVMYRSTPYLVR